METLTMDTRPVTPKVALKQHRAECLDALAKLRAVNDALDAFEAFPVPVDGDGAPETDTGADLLEALGYVPGRCVRCETLDILHRALAYMCEDCRDDVQAEADADDRLSGGRD